MLKPLRDKPAIAAIVAVAAVLAVGVGIGLGVGHLFHPPSRPPARPQVAALASVPMTEDETAKSPAPLTGDDVNGPAEVVPAEQPPIGQAPALKAPEPQADRPAAAGPGRPAWRRFAVTPPPVQNRPMIAVVIDDMGLDRKRAEKVIALRAPLTLAFMTYAEDLPRLTAEAHARGHELMVHMPMQPQAASFNAGPDALTVGATDEDLRQRIDWGLSRFTGYVGINNHMGSRFTEDEAGMAVVMHELSKRGLMFLDSVTTSHSVAAEAATRNHVPFAARQVFLDNEQSRDAIAAQLGRTEAAARKHGYAIAIGHPHDTTIAALTDWLESVESRGFVIVPVTAIVMKAHEKG
jgi:polysaccharide deacetylase 2 family uncharacterized protein YibQ